MINNIDFIVQNEIMWVVADFNECIRIMLYEGISTLHIMLYTTEWKVLVQCILCDIFF